MKKVLLGVAGLTVAFALTFVIRNHVPGTVPPVREPEKTAEKVISPLILTFSATTCHELLSLARAAVNAAVNGDRVSCGPCSNPELQVKAGCFVTLRNQGVLRGCIGRLGAEDPLWQTVCAVAVSSARHDVRFAHNPITSKELGHLEIEISVISPMREISHPLEEIRLGRDGIVIMDKGRSGTFLPQVAAETGWNLEEFLGHCARDKAGLAWDGWKSPTARVLAYTATIVSEKDFASAERK